MDTAAHCHLMVVHPLGEDKVIFSYPPERSSGGFLVQSFLPPFTYGTSGSNIEGKQLPEEFWAGLEMITVEVITSV